ncbi:MAG: hypothetical protein ACHP84_05225 [Caulobacterales bacterium]
MRGRKPTPTVIKLALGNPGKRRLPVDEPMPEGKVEKPRNLRGKASEIWDRVIARAFWLTWADLPKAIVWCHLQAEFERRPGKMVASRFGLLRALGSDLGFDPAARARLGVGTRRRPNRFAGLIDGDTLHGRRGFLGRP